MKWLVGMLTTTASGAVLYWVPPLAWGIAASCVIITITFCTLIVCAFFGQKSYRRTWIIKVIAAWRKGS